MLCLKVKTKLVALELNPEGDRRVNKDIWQVCFPGMWNGKWKALKQEWACMFRKQQGGAVWMKQKKMTGEIGRVQVREEMGLPYRRRATRLSWVLKELCLPGWKETKLKDEGRKQCQIWQLLGSSCKESSGLDREPVAEPMRHEWDLEIL